MELKLVDSDGHPYPDEENPVVMGFEFEVGRPPGMKAGEPQSVVLSSKLVGLSFAPGRYSWDLYYNGNKLPDSTTFTAMDRG